MKGNFLAMNVLEGLCELLEKKFNSELKYLQYKESNNKNV